MPDLTGFVTWDRLEDALKGIRESIEKSSNDAAAALASARQPVHVVERQSQTVSKRFHPSISNKNMPPFFLSIVSETKGKHSSVFLIHPQKSNSRNHQSLLLILLHRITLLKSWKNLEHYTIDMNNYAE